MGIQLVQKRKVLITLDYLSFDFKPNYWGVGCYNLRL